MLIHSHLQQFKSIAVQASPQSSNKSPSLSKTKYHKATKNKLETGIRFFKMFVQSFISKVIKHSMKNGQAKAVKLYPYAASFPSDISSGKSISLLPFFFFKSKPGKGFSQKFSRKVNLWTKTKHKNVRRKDNCFIKLQVRKDSIKLQENAENSYVTFNLAGRYRLPSIVTRT